MIDLAGLKRQGLGYVLDQLGKIKLSSLVRMFAGEPLQRALTAPTNLEPLLPLLVAEKMAEPKFQSDAAKGGWSADVQRWRAQERVQVDLAFGRVDTEVLRRLGFK